MTNGKYLDPHMAFTPLKHNINIMKPKLILREDDVPVNFTHLGQYVYTSGNRIFGKKKNWKAAPRKTAPQRDQEQRDESFLKDPVVFHICYCHGCSPAEPHQRYQNGMGNTWRRQTSSQRSPDTRKQGGPGPVLRLYRYPLQHHPENNSDDIARRFQHP